MGFNVSAPSGIVTVIAVLALCGCGDEKSAGTAGGAAVGFRQACSACHLLPRPDALPTSAWPAVIDQMISIAEVSTVTTLHPDDAAGAREFYVANSQSSLRNHTAAEARRDDVGLWSAVHLSPPGLEATLVPAVSHVAIGTMGAVEPLSLLVSEMRSRTLLHFPFAGAPDVSPVLYPILRDLNYPGRFTWTDLNADGLSDLVISGIGSMQPNNATSGNVFVVQQQLGRTFQRQIVAAGLGRPADVFSGDFDSDGDQDIALAAFGLRDAGQLAILENRGENLDMRLHQLDARDGFTSLKAADFDGDGAIDLVALLAQEHEEVIVFKNEGEFKFSAHLVWKAPHPSWAFCHLQVEDLDADGKPDIITTNGDSLDYDVVKPYSGVQCFRNSGRLKFQSTAIGALAGAACSATADMDGDGDLDVAATAFMPLSSPTKWIENELESIVWFENPGNQPAENSAWLKHVVEFHSACHPTVALADCDADGATDIVVGNYVWIDEKKGPLFRSPYVSIYTRRPR